MIVKIEWSELNYNLYGSKIFLEQHFCFSKPYVYRSSQIFPQLFSITWKVIPSHCWSTWFLYMYTIIITRQSCIAFLIIKPTRCTNFSNLFLEWNSTCFGQFLCPSSGIFHCTHRIGKRHTSLLTACEQEQMLLLSSSQQTSMTYTIAVCTVKNSWWRTEELPETCRVSFQNKFEKLVHLVGFIVRSLSRCAVTWTSIFYSILYRVRNVVSCWCLKTYRKSVMTGLGGRRGRGRYYVIRHSLSTMA